MSSETTNTVDAIGRINFEGNIIPSSWYQNIKGKDGKPDFSAITILSDIVYWYRPSEIRDEQTGRVIGYKKKFAADKLQRGYEQLGAQFGLSKEQARDACHRLRDLGLISIEIRHGVRYGQGMIANNVVYLEPNPEALLDITYRVTQMGAAKQPSPPLDVDTNTETTTKTTTNSLSNDDEPKTEQLQKQDTFGYAWDVLSSKFQNYGGIINPKLYENFENVFRANPEQRDKRLEHALKKLNDTRSLYKAIDAYREWTPPKPPPEYATRREQYQRPKVSHLPIRTD